MAMVTFLKTHLCIECFWQDKAFSNLHGLLLATLRRELHLPSECQQEDISWVFVKRVGFLALGFTTVKCILNRQRLPFRGIRQLFRLLGA